MLLDYRAHQRRLLPRLARSYALAFAQNELVARMHDVQSVVQHGGTADPHAPARARGAGRGPQGADHVARDAHHPGVPRGVRRRRLPGGEPAAAAQGRHRRVHHVRGRQHGAAAAGRQGAAGRYASEFGGLDTWGMVRFATRQVADHGRGAHRGAGPDPAAGRRRPPRRLQGPARARHPAVSCWRTGSSTCSRRWPAGCAARQVRRRRLVRRLQRRAAARAAAGARRTSSGSLLEAFVAGIDGCDDDRREGDARQRLRPVRARLRRVGQGLVPRARPADPGPVEGGHGDDRRAVRRAAPAHRRPGRGFGIPDGWLGAAMLAD